MSAREATRLKTLKTLDLSRWSTSFWVVKRKGGQPPYEYGVLRVNIEAKLARRLKGYVKSQIQEREVPIEAYDFSTADPGEKLLTLDSASTDFDKVEKAIDAGFDNPHAKDYEELLSSWAYVVLFESGEQRLFAWRKINTLNNPKRVMSRQALFFEDQRLVDVDDKQVFMIDPRFDFFAFEGTAFIASKASFEASMSFREGMKKNSDDLLAAFKKLDFLTEIEPIRQYVGENVHHLRKLAAIKNAGYYNQAGYLAKLMAVVKTEKWNLKIANGKIVVEEQTMELLLKLLNNDRLRSPINDEVFDSSAKTAVTGRPAAR
jgi:Domain of unknown function (DUF4868)